MVSPNVSRSKVTHLSELAPRSALLSQWERFRHRQAHWLVECIAEFTGVFLYTYAGTGSTAGWILGTLAELTVSSLFQVGIAYAIGIVLATVICSSTSGGHFSPGVTISQVIFKGFPPLKALRYIIAQILGAYVGCLLVYVQYHHLIEEIETGLKAKKAYDLLMFTPQGPGGIFGLYVAPGSKLGQVFVNEFVSDFVIGITTFSVFDPTNFFATPIASPWIIGFVYAVAVWGYAPVGLAANSARDIGGRLMAMTIWGMDASGGPYAAIAALTNTLAFVVAALFYEFIVADSARVVTSSHLEYLTANAANRERHEELVSGKLVSSITSLEEKGADDEIERV